MIIFFNIRAIQKTYGSAGDEIVEFVMSLSASDFKKIALEEALSDIGYVYYDQLEANKKLQHLKNQITAIIGANKGKQVKSLGSSKSFKGQYFTSAKANQIYVRF